MNVPMSLPNGKSIELNNITESGTGYIRFSDGTQICYGFNRVPNPGKKTHRMSYKFTYPKPFKDVPVCSINRQATIPEDSNIDIIDKDYAIDRITSGNSACLFDAIYTQGETDMINQLNTSYIAIGRWK